MRPVLWQRLPSRAKFNVGDRVAHYAHPGGCGTISGIFEEGGALVTSEVDWETRDRSISQRMRLFHVAATTVVEGSNRRRSGRQRLVMGDSDDAPFVPPVS